ncbi:phosphoribosylanthranilate isomerase [Candidatus Venteria ishoeyi]|uniref:phosphoribosylanthranilate isomerase n=1 Tax=Candidatus Venteria ishoeyi TaxID=1899563 RepID=UPI0025A66A19|nr:phosphoribosylanthranilate isomerase [Candidatus Venteria ishoeyi]MDM8545514.1 phosphoribosylanthranilate isomerase [Candidatus Venteria ishoeyi]
MNTNTQVALLMTTRTRIKICGITRLEDAQDACHAGADALGFVFYDKSPRAVSIKQVQEIISAVPAFVTSVGLFVNPEPEFVHAVLKHIPLDLLQFHGEETPQQCAAFSRPYIKAIRMRPGTDVYAQAALYQSARGLLLDAYVPGVKGGTGTAFNWKEIPAQVAKPVILAGGLDASNVAHAIHTVRPWAVDVSGGVEVKKGIKSTEKIREFAQQVNDLNSI